MMKRIISIVVTIVLAQIALPSYAKDKTRIGASLGTVLNGDVGLGGLFDFGMTADVFVAHEVNHNLELQGELGWMMLSSSDEQSFFFTFARPDPVRVVSDVRVLGLKASVVLLDNPGPLGQFYFLFATGVSRLSEEERIDYAFSAGPGFGIRMSDSGAVGLEGRLEALFFRETIHLLFPVRVIVSF